MAVNDDSVLGTTKELLGIAEENTDFDKALVTLINGAFSSLQSLGIGPSDAYFIDDESNLWSEFIIDKKNIRSVKVLVYLKVRINFDTPTTSFGINAAQAEIAEHEFRLYTECEKGILVPNITDPLEEG